MVLWALLIVGSAPSSIFPSNRLDSIEYYADAAAYDNGNGTPDGRREFTYDDRGRVAQIQEFDDTGLIRVETTVYNDRGLVANVTSDEGVISYQYNDFGDLIAKSFSPREYAWDPSRTHSDQTLYDYDQLGRLTRVTTVNRSGVTLAAPEHAEYTYDLAGSLDQTIYATGVMGTESYQRGLIHDYEYDALGRLEELTHWADINANGRVDADEIRASFDYTLRADGKRVRAEEKFYDSAGQLASENVFAWRYDDADRLISEIATGDSIADYDLSWVYDHAGNRLQQDHAVTENEGNPQRTTHYTYDANDRLSSEVTSSRDVDAPGLSATNYAYDKTQQTRKVTVADGQVTVQEFAYNLQGRMSRVSTTQGNETSQFSYEYDVAGNRVAATTDDGSTVTRTEYLTDDRNPTGYSQVLQETTFDDSDNPTEKVVYSIGHDQVTQTTYSRSGNDWTPGETAYFGTDGHGSVRVLYDLASVVIASSGVEQFYHFDAYGNPIGNAWTGPGAPQPITSYLYSGESFDFTINQQYLRARWYDATTGRFNRLDPYFGSNSDPQSFHKYAYAHGDPVSYNDPSGNFIGAVIGLGLELAVPGPGDLIQAGLEALVQAYVVNLEWDLEWALDFDLPDSWGSRLDNTWVYSALGAGLHDAFDIWTPFGTMNPLDAFGDTADFASRGLRGPSGGSSRVFLRLGNVARHSLTSMIPYVHNGIQVASRVSYYYHPKLNQYIVKYAENIKATTLNIKANRPRSLSSTDVDKARTADIVAANKKLRKDLPAGWKIARNDGPVEINGELYTWHHGNKKGTMELIPTDLHRASQADHGRGEGPHIGVAMWWKYF